MTCSCALLAYFEGEQGGDLVRSLLYDASRDRVRLLLCLVNWGELSYIVMQGPGSYLAAWELPSLISTRIPARLHMLIR